VQHLIIGNGPAGVVAAETLRAERPDDAIVLLGDEPEPPYSRMAIPYLLEGKIGEDGTYLRKTPHHFQRLGIALEHGRAVALDTAARSVTLADGRRLAYDRLLIACGAQPVSPPIPGIDLPGVLTCWTLADARRIAAAVQTGARVLQLGAGFIGCIIMESLVARGARLTVVEMADRMVPRMMPPGAAALLRRRCEARGVRVMTETRIAAIARTAAGLAATTAAGETLEADVIIAAAGVRPNVGWLAGSGVAVATGIVVDHRLATNVDGVYAAGDCAESEEIGTGAHIVNAVQPDAVDQARTAALNMAGRDTRLVGTLQMNVLDTFDLVSTSFGQWQGVAGGSQVERTDPHGERYLRLEFDDDVLIGATAIGHTARIGVLRALIQGRMRLGAWKDKLLLDPTLLADAYIARAQTV
jgi:NAD(P)H-nitrite reductase large subunit